MVENSPFPVTDWTYVSEPLLIILKQCVEIIHLINPDSIMNMNAISFSKESDETHSATMMHKRLAVSNVT